MYQELAKKYRTFDKVEQLNYAVRKHLYNNKHLMTPTAISVLKVLARHAVKYVGVAYLKVDNIAKAVDKHRNTVIKAVKLLVELNIIEKLTQYRPKNGGNGANIYVIQRFKPVHKTANKTVKNNNVTPRTQLRANTEKPRSTSIKAVNNANETMIAKSYNKIINKLRSETPYSEFKNWVSAYVKDNKLTNKLYGIYKAQTHYIKGVYDNDLLLNIAIQAIKTTFSATKRKNIKSLTGYFNGVLDKLLDSLYYSHIE
ncbi:helix-turn-helix domain-containing protein [Priestia megaterium]|uniref:helix-turn-helix domain-containing protein n=1 Tax=Priestia megaterium TaxID=1404 RepID=UPI002E1F08DD|nr:helix-turn-helix domain-containing protein [Priestia megaterium]